MRITTILLAALTVFGLGACASGAGRSFFGPPPPRDLIAFPKSEAIADSPATFIRGVLVLKDGCIRVENAEGSRLVIWPSSSTLAPGGAGGHDPTTGRSALVGQTMVGSGQALDSVDPTRFNPPIPSICVGPYWLAATGYNTSPPAP